LGAGGDPKINFGNLKIPFNIFQLTSNGIAQFSGSTSGDSGWRRFPSGTPIGATVNPGDIFGRLIWNVGASVSPEGNVSASLSGTFGGWYVFVNPPPADINQADIHPSVGPVGISSNGSMVISEAFHDLTTFAF